RCCCRWCCCSRGRCGSGSRELTHAPLIPAQVGIQFIGSGSLLSRGRAETGMTGRVCIAQIGAAHGVRGEVRLKPFTEDPLSVTRYGALESEDGKRRFEIEAVRPAKDVLVARLKGVTDRNAAEALKNMRLYVAREKLPRPEADEFYHADLVGLTAQKQ